MSSEINDFCKISNIIILILYVSKSTAHSIRVVLYFKFGLLWPDLSAYTAERIGIEIGIENEIVLQKMETKFNNFYFKLARKKIAF